MIYRCHNVKSDWRIRKKGRCCTGLHADAWQSAEKNSWLWEARISTIGPNQLRLSSTSVLRSRERTQDPSRAGRYRAEAARCFIVVSSISKQRSNHRTGVSTRNLVQHCVLFSISISLIWFFLLCIWLAKNLFYTESVKM